MKDKQYKVIFTGNIRPNYNIESVKRNLINSFNITESHIEKLFSGRRIIVKKNINYRKALFIKEKMAHAGVLCEIEPIQLNDTKDESQKAKMIRCPKCGYVRKTTDMSSDYKCPKCGVIYANVPEKIQNGTKNKNGSFEQSHNLANEKDKYSSGTTSSFTSTADTKESILMTIAPYLPTEPRELLSKEGRVNRAKFLCTQILLGAVEWLVLVILPDRGPAKIISGFLGFILVMALIVMMAFNIIKRFHDIERSGENFWLLIFVPFWNLYLAYLLFFVKGTQGPNQYGPDLLQ